MAELGVDLYKLYFDLCECARRIPPISSHPEFAYAFHPHRDTWMPIYPLHAENAIGFYPRYFAEAVANNSEITTIMQGQESVKRGRACTQ